MAKLPQMLSITECSKACGLAPYRVRQLALTGTVRSIRAGSKIYINSDSLADFLNGKTENFYSAEPSIRKINLT